MSKNLGQAMLDLAEILCNPIRSVATGGSATTVIDTVFPWRMSDGLFPPDDTYNEGGIWMLSGLNAGKFAQITNWDYATQTFTFPTMTLVNATGDRYAVADKDWPLFELQRAVNQALAHIGAPLTKYENAALKTVANQDAYTLPAGVRDVRNVFIANNSAAPYDWEEHHWWNILDTLLLFQTDHIPDTDDLLIRLMYRPAVSDLVAYADAINDLIDPDRLRWEAAYWALRWRVVLMRDNRADLVKLLNEAIVNRQEEAESHSLPMVQPGSNWGEW